MTENVTLQPERTDTPVIDTTPAPKVPKKKFKLNPVFLGVLIGLFSASSLFAAYYFVAKPNLSPGEEVTTDPTPTSIEVTQSPESDSEFGKLTWLPTPIKVNNPAILATPDDQGYSYTIQATYQVADFSSGAKLLNIVAQPDSPAGPSVFRVIQKDNSYLVLDFLATETYEKEELDKVFDSAKTDYTSFSIPELIPPESITDHKRNAFLSQATFGRKPMFSEYENPVKISSSDYGDFYAVYDQPYSEKELYSRDIFLKLPDSTVQSYTYKFSFISDDRIPAVVYTTSGANTDRFEAGLPYGCGLGGSQTIIRKDSSLISSKVEVGQLGGNSSLVPKIYQVKDLNSDLVKFLYSQYKIGRDYQDAPQYLSIEEYARQNNHFLYQDPSGDYILFVNSQYAPAVECGKPVVYLYPETETQVTVKVAADITKSEPLYPNKGWTVLAKPNGQLTYQGTVYPNLFWEGLGHGPYPNKSYYGTLVTQDKLIPTLYSQLKAQGLNQQESSDFMDFWASRLPKDPYVRLTWLNTRDMDILAPLDVSPRPDTSIRVFLEFEGYQTPVKLLPQKLSSIPRKGFTLIEWGGLLIGK